jgi:hypothetical protein
MQDLQNVLLTLSTTDSPACEEICCQFFSKQGTAQDIVDGLE